MTFTQEGGAMRSVPAVCWLLLVGGVAAAWTLDGWRHWTAVGVAYLAFASLVGAAMHDGRPRGACE